MRTRKEQEEEKKIKRLDGTYFHRINCPSVTLQEAHLILCNVYKCECTAEICCWPEGVEMVNQRTFLCDYWYSAAEIAAISFC